MDLPFFVFSLALGGVIIASACLFYLFRQRSEIAKGLLHALKEAGFFQQLLDSFQFTREIENLADEKLDHLVINFKERVPMVGVFLIGELEMTLKRLAKEEFLSMIPQMEKNIGDRQRDFYAKILKNLHSIPLNFFSKLFVRLILPVLALGGILGAIFGLILYFLRPN